jgi:mycothiol synthase
LQELIESLGQPGHCPEENLFVTDKAGKVVGYVDVIPELNIGRAVISGMVHSEHREKELAKMLVERAVRRAFELKAKRVHVNIPSDNARVERLFVEMGFEFVRRYLEMRLDLSETKLPGVNRNASRCRHMKRGEEGKLAELQNRSFADTWGFNPNTAEDITYRTCLHNCFPDDVLLTCKGEEPVGYCWTRIYRGEGGVPTEAIRGRIAMLGVDPEHRGKGIGKTVLGAGLSYLKWRGAGSIELTVDSENKPACALYRSAAFRVHAQSLWFERALGKS